MTTTADQLGIVTGEAVALDVRATSFVLRAAGAMIDLVAGVTLFFGLLFGIGLLASLLHVDGSAVAALAIVDVVVSWVIAPAVLEIATRGRSLGKLAVGARIVRDDGGAISPRHAFVRALMGLVDFWFTFGGTAVIVGLLNGKSKRLGDLLAGTVAQQERVPAVRDMPVGVPPVLAAWAEHADVARLPEALSRRIAAFLQSAARMTPESRSRIAVDLATEAAPYIAPLPDAHPELLLAAVTAIRRDREFAALMLERERFTKLAPILTANPHAFPER